MFQEYYGFTRAPFSKTIETDKLFATAGQKELTARLTYLVRERGCGLVTGEIGSGKSTAVRAFTAGLDANSYLVIYLANPTTGSMGLYRELLLTLGHEPPFTKPRMVSRIRTALTDLRINKRRTPLVIIDEAHLLTQPMLEELRLLFSDKMDSESLATLVLVGHPDLRRTLHLSVNEAFSPAPGDALSPRPAGPPGNHRLRPPPRQGCRLQRRPTLHRRCHYPHLRVHQGPATPHQPTLPHRAHGRLD